MTRTPSELIRAWFNPDTQSFSTRALFNLKISWTLLIPAFSLVIRKCDWMTSSLSSGLEKTVWISRDLRTNPLKYATMQNCSELLNLKRKFPHLWNLLPAYRKTLQAPGRFMQSKNYSQCCVLVFICISTARKHVKVSVSEDRGEETFANSFTQTFQIWNNVCDNIFK